MKQCYQASSVLKLSLMILISLFFWECGQKEDPLDKEEIRFIGNDEYYVNPQKAIDLAFKFSFLNESTESDDSNIQSRRGKRKNQVGTIETKSEQEKQIFHVINYQDDEGFVIVSADKRITPILAFSESGKFVIDESLGGIQDWIKVVKENSLLAQNEEYFDEDINYLWDKLENFNIEVEGFDDSSGKNERSNYSGTCNPYLTPCPNNYTTSTGPLVTPLAEWSQRHGYNFYSPSRSCGSCSKALTGCGPVAIAQIMRYYRRPTNYNYNIMPQTITPKCTNLTEGELQMAHLIFFAGTSSATDYRSLPNCNTWTNPANIKNSFKTALYSNSGSLYNFTSNLERVRISLQSGHPMIIMGTTCNTCVNPSHIWVLDGYMRNTYFDLDCSSGYPTCRETGFTYYHLNWGWGQGQDGLNFNGWFALNNFRNRQSNELYNSWLNVYMDMRP